MRATCVASTWQPPWVLRSTARAIRPRAASPSGFSAAILSCTRPGSRCSYWIASAGSSSAKCATPSVDRHQPVVRADDEFLQPAEDAIAGGKTRERGVPVRGEDREVAGAIAHERHHLVVEAR